MPSVRFPGGTTRLVCLVGRDANVLRDPSFVGSGGDIEVAKIVEGVTGSGYRSEESTKGEPGWIWFRRIGSLWVECHSAGIGRRHKLICPTIWKVGGCGDLSDMGVWTVWGVEVEGLIFAGRDSEFIFGLNAKVIGRAFCQATEGNFDILIFPA